MRSLADWKKSGMSFSKFCAVGEEVNEEMIDYFINIVPAAYLKNRLAQCGEPCNHIFDEIKGCMRATYITFENIGGKWYYRGECFMCETVNREEE